MNYLQSVPLRSLHTATAFLLLCGVAASSGPLPLYAPEAKLDGELFPQDAITPVDASFGYDGQLLSPPLLARPARTAVAPSYIGKEVASPTLRRAPIFADPSRPIETDPYFPSHETFPEAYYNSPTETSPDIVRATAEHQSRQQAHLRAIRDRSYSYQEPSLPAAEISPETSQTQDAMPTPFDRPSRVERREMMAQASSIHRAVEDRQPTGRAGQPETPSEIPVPSDYVNQGQVAGTPVPPSSPPAAVPYGYPYPGQMAMPVQMPMPQQQWPGGATWVYFPHLGGWGMINAPTTAYPTMIPGNPYMQVIPTQSYPQGVPRTVQQQAPNRNVSPQSPQAPVNPPSQQPTQPNYPTVNTLPVPGGPYFAQNQVNPNAPTTAPAPTAPGNTATGAETEEKRAPGDPTVKYPEMKVTPVDPLPPGIAPPTTSPEASDPSQLLRNHEYEELGMIIMAESNAGLARGMAWNLYRDGQYAAAIQWFSQSLVWEETSYEAYYGIALSEFNRGNLKQAEAIANTWKDAYPGMKNLLGDIMTEKAMAAYNGERFDSAVGYFKRIESVRGMTMDEQTVYAWSLLNSGDPQTAAAKFENLYSASLSTQHAQGLFAAYAELEKWDHVGRLATRYDGPLGDLYNQHMAKVSFNQGLYRTAAKYDPDTYGVMENTYSTRVSLAGGAKSKSGDSSLDDLDVEILPAVDFSFPVGDYSTVGVELVGKNYRQSEVRRKDLFGTFPDDDRDDFVTNPETGISAMGATVRWEREGTIAPFAEMGAREAISGVNGIYTGEVGIEKNDRRGQWSVALYRDSIEESAISSVGQIDPYTGKVWGGVTETGLGGDVMLQFENDVLFQGSASFGGIRGTNVASNEHWRVAVGLKKDFKVSGFEYFSVGPVFSYDRYTRNLSQYTFGQGGYFSPQSLVQGTLSLDFMTREGGEFLVRGGVGFGAQKNTQEASPLFPLSPDGRYYDEVNTSAGVFYAHLAGVHQLTDTLNFGTKLSYARTPSYDDFTGLFYLSLGFHSTPGLYEYDLLY